MQVGQHAPIVHRLKSLLSKENPATINTRPIESGDIAILVRTAGEGQALAAVLQSEGIACVTIGNENVFDSDEARGLYQLLIAIAGFDDPATARLSLASSLLSFDYRKIAGVIDHDREWQDWLDRLTELNEIWQQRGFIAMFQHLLYQLDLTSSFSQQRNGERRLTNLLHLADLLQQQSVGLPGVNALLTWFRHQFEQPVNATMELRLESDEALVKIVTIHKSKGLQYPVVFVPFLWTCRPVSQTPPVYFHDEQMQPVFDLGTEQLAAHRQIAEQARLAEDLRLLYVALTRAKSRVYLAWGEAGDARKPGYASETALAYLLHSKQEPDELGRVPVNGFPDDMDFERDLQNLVAGSEGTIMVEPLPRQPASNHTDPAPLPERGTLALFTRQLKRPWRINSFSGLTRHIHQTGSPGSQSLPADPVLAFPAGSHVGLLLHSVLEHLDFTGDIADQCQTLLPERLEAAGISGDTEQKTLVGWLEQIVATPLNHDGLALNRISGDSRLNELPFDFSLDCLKPDRLNSLFQSFTEHPLQPVNSIEFGGLITGVIDLVFEFNGRFYLADYKSNYLGASLDEYHPDRLRTAIFERRYDLQSMLYSLALHRYLQARLPGYQFSQHFGGSFYLFLRGMRPDQNTAYGVYFESPTEARIQALEKLFEFTSHGPDAA